MIRPVGWLLVAANAAVIGLFAYMLTTRHNPNAIPSVLIGKPAPDFALPGLDPGGPGVSRAELGEGRVHLVNFWASWCLPCQVEHPLLMRLSKRPDLGVVGIAWKDDPPKARAMLERLGNPFAKTGNDAEGRVGIDWGISGVPETFVVDGTGRVLARVAGPLTERDLHRTIEPALAAARAPAVPGP